MTNKEIIALNERYLFATYARAPMALVRGQGCRVWDADGKEYLDFFASTVVTALGHCHPRVTQAIVEQANKILHVSNLHHSEPQAILAELLCTHSFADRVFFCNSGTEANEAALKFARKWAKINAGIDPYDAAAIAAASPPSDLLSFDNCFHGRTMGALALTYKSQYKTPFGPGLPGGVSVPFLDLAAAEAVLARGTTAAVFVEPLQGEGGIHPASKAFLAGLRAACDRHGALLVFDEVQVGLGRTGALWAHDHFGVTPDIMTLAKPLAGGLPIGAALLTERVAAAMAPGDHGSTFAGNPLVCAAGVAVFDAVAAPAFLAAVSSTGARLRDGLAAGLKGVPGVVDVRGLGLIIGVELDRPAGGIVDRAREAGLLILTAGAGNVVRLVPPLVLTPAEADEAVAKLVPVIKAELSA